MWSFLTYGKPALGGGTYLKVKCSQSRVRGGGGGTVNLDNVTKFCHVPLEFIRKMVEFEKGSGRLDN